MIVIRNAAQLEFIKNPNRPKLFYRNFREFEKFGGGVARGGRNSRNLEGNNGARAGKEEESDHGKHSNMQNEATAKIVGGCDGGAEGWEHSFLVGDSICVCDGCNSGFHVYSSSGLGHVDMDATHLKKIPLFAELGAEEAEAIAVVLRRQTLKPHEALFWIGDRGEDFYVIERGRINITFPDHSGREITLATLGAGDFLGELALLDGGPRSATARAANEAVVLCLGREEFHRIVRQHPASAIHMMTVLGKRQRETVDRLRGIRNVNEVVIEQSTRGQRLSGSIASAAASGSFLIAHAILFGGWIFLNSLLKSRAIDPYPYSFLGFWASCEAIFLSMFVLMSQNVQARKDRIRTEIEYQVALKMQVEIMQLHQKIDQLPATLLENSVEKSDGEVTASPASTTAAQPR